MKKLTFSFLILFTTSVVFSASINEVKIDSILTHVENYTASIIELRQHKDQDLIQYLNQSTDDLAKCKINNALCWRFFSSDPPKAMEYAIQQEVFAKKINNQDAIIASYDNFAYLHLGFSDYEEAISYMLQALKIKESINDAEGITVSLSGLASTYYKMNNYELALKYFKEIYDVEKKAKRRSNMATILCNIGLCYTALGEVDEGLSSYLEAEELFLELGLDDEMGDVYGNIGDLYSEFKDDDKTALFYYKKAIKLHLDKDDASSLAAVYASVSEIYSKQNDFNNALIYANMANKYALISTDKNDILNSHKSLSNVYYQGAKYKLAYDHFLIAFNTQDTIYGEHSAQQIAEMQTKYDTEKKETENNLLRTEQKLDKAEIDRKSTQQMMLLIVLGLSLLVVIYVAYSLIQKKKTNKLLHVKNEEISLKNDIIEEKNKDITDSINYAQRIQNAILPEIAILEKNFEPFIYYKPKDIVSGDFYWIKEMGNKIFFAVVDCTGHGVPGAFMSIIGYHSLNKIVEDLKIENTGKILDELNKEVNKALGIQLEKEVSIRDGMDISICCIDKSDNSLLYSGANNSLYLLKNKKNSLKGFEPILENDNSLFYEIKSNKMAIGGGLNHKTYQAHSFQLDKGDSIYLFSDGYADQFGGPKGKKFMYKPFKRMILSFQDEAMDAQCSILNKTMIEWMGDIEQLDDICLMGIKI